VTTTTTTAAVTTTTTTVSVSCGTLVSGAQEYGVSHAINIGAGGIGREIVFTINVIDAPDKFIIENGGVEVLNTGYRGDVGFQQPLYDALALLGEPAEVILDKSVTRFSFIKTSADAIAVVKVYAPLIETEWSFALSCPVVTTTTTIMGMQYSGTYSDFLCQETDDGSPVVTTTTTTAAVTTTTTTGVIIPVETVTCGEDWHTGGYAYPYVYVVIGMGTGIGWVDFSCFTFDIPDKFIVEFNGVEVINTGLNENPCHMPL